MNDHSLYDLIERISNLIRAEERKAASRFGLQPVHLHALRYVANCNRYSNTPAAVTEYLGATKGTVSQTLLVLKHKGFIAGETDPVDRRVMRLSVTEQGKQVLAGCIPPPLLRETVKRHVESQTDIETSWREMLRSMQRIHQFRSFGVCKTCRFFQSLSPEGEFHCGLTGEALSDADSIKICREHEPAGVD